MTDPPDPRDEKIKVLEKRLFVWRWACWFISALTILYLIFSVGSFVVAIEVFKEAISREMDRNKRQEERMNLEIDLLRRK